MKILQFTDKEDKKILTKVLPECKTDEDYKLAVLQAPRMLHYCKKHNGMGLSANQIGIEKRFFVIHTKTIKQLFINPRFKNYKNKVPSMEGCFSFSDGRKTLAARYLKIRVYFHDKNGDEYYMNLTGEDAIVFQHELDHMNGKII